MVFLSSIDDARRKYMTKLPMLRYIREVLEDHTLPLEGTTARIIEAIWLIHMLNTMERVYKSNGS